jgi:hypothetical protein
LNSGRPGQTAALLQSQIGAYEHVKSIEKRKAILNSVPFICFIFQALNPGSLLPLLLLLLPPPPPLLLLLLLLQRRNSPRRDLATSVFRPQISLTPASLFNHLKFSNKEESILMFYHLSRGLPTGLPP